MKNNTLRLLDSAILEVLEGRDMMSASPLGVVSFSGGVLTLDAAANQSTQMSVSFWKKNTSQIVARSGSSVEKVPTSEVQQIVINAGSSTSNISINPAITAPTTVNVSTGNAGVKAGTGDTINAGSGRTAIQLQGNDNTVNLGAGIGVVKATGDGSNTVNAGAGEAIVNGGNGHGSIVGASSKLRLVNAQNDNVVKASSPTGGSSNTSTTSNTGTSSSSSGGTTGTTSTGSTGTSGDSGSSSSPPSTVVHSDPGSGMGTTATDTAATAPQPAITMVSGTQQVGLPVNVSGLSSTLGAGTVLDATYAWNFGDANGAHNQITGYSAGHIYDTPGTYTITLTLTNANGETSTATQQVTVAASTRNVIYVSATGSDSNNGSENAPYATLAKAFSNIADNTEVLLQAGGTYSVDSSININGSNIVVSSYGTGDAPVISRVKGSGIGAFNVNGSANGVTFENLTFDSPYAVAAGQTAPKNGVSGIFVGGSNIAVRDCTFLNVDDALNENAQPTGVLIEDNTAPLKTGLRGYFVWGAGSQTTIIGNTVAASTNEHNIRMYTWNQFTIEDNSLTNWDGKGTIEMQVGSYGYVEGNVTTGGEVRTGPLGEWGEPVTDTTSWVVITNNVINDNYIDVRPASDHVLIEDNVLNENGMAQIEISGPSPLGATSADIEVESNTGIDTATTGGFLEVTGAVNGIVLTNNLWVAPNAVEGGWSTAAVTVELPDLSDFTTIADNIWPDPAKLYAYANGGVNYVGTSGDPYVSDAQWNAFSQVHNDQFYNIATSDLVSTYQVTEGGVTAGAAMPLAA